MTENEGAECGLGQHHLSRAVGPGVRWREYSTSALTASTFWWLESLAGEREGRVSGWPATVPSLGAHGELLADVATPRR